MKIHITKEHIKNGKPNHHKKCPGALALKDAGFKRISANNITLMVDGHSYATPTKLHFFIARFDRGEKVKPITFEIDARPKGK